MGYIQLLEYEIPPPPFCSSRKSGSNEFPASTHHRNVCGGSVSWSPKDRQLKVEAQKPPRLLTFGQCVSPDYCDGVVGVGVERIVYSRS